MKKFLKSFLLIGGLVSIFSFMPAKIAHSDATNSKKFFLTVVDYQIGLGTNGWEYQVEVNPQSSTHLVDIQFICNITEPGGTVLTNVHINQPNVGGEEYNYTLDAWEYVLFVNVAGSGYPAGSTSSNVHSVTVGTYIPF